MYNLMIIRYNCTIVVSFKDPVIALKRQAALNRLGFKTLLEEVQFFDDVSDSELFESIDKTLND